MGAKRGLLRELIRIFAQEDWPRISGDLTRSINIEDAAGVSGAAHAVKGLAGEFRAPAAYLLAERMENQAGRGSLTGIDASARVLEHEVARLIEELTAFVENDSCWDAT
jgi:HPt (histidine-containing phosphotransfer) domain-containing protein